MVGIILPEVDMPYTVDGMIPDIIINPHGLPSRMTVAQLFESLLGKLCCLRGSQGDGTPFVGNCSRKIGQDLESYGFENRGNESLFNGITGQLLTTTVFIGPVHYQRLKHCVVDKMHARSRGPVQVITRQPGTQRVTHRCQTCRRLSCRHSDSSPLWHRGR